MMHARSLPALRRTVAVLAAAALTTALAGCGSSGSADSNTLTVYTDQHAELVQALTAQYTKETGVKFKIQNDATVGQIQAEGNASPADVFLSEDPGPVAELATQGLLTPVQKQTLDQVRSWLNPRSGDWVGYSARARVLYYNPKKISESQLPARLMDITEPQYKGKFAWAPSGAFVATTQYLIATIGKARTQAFLQKIKANGIDEQSNGNVRDTVEAGVHAMGLSNHYYWWVKAAEVGGPRNMTSKVYHFPGVDPGNLVLSSGAGILKSSSHKSQDAKFLHWLTSPDGGQKIIAANEPEVNEGQYPTAKGVASQLVGSISSIKSPHYDMDLFGDQAEAEDLLKTLGMSS